MRLSAEQMERLAERVFKVVKTSGHVGFDLVADPRLEDNAIETIMQVLIEDARLEEKLSKEAERLVMQQGHIAKASGMSSDELVNEVKVRLARSKKVQLGDGPDRADLLGEKVFRALWKLDGMDFFSPDQKIMNCIAKAIYRFRMEDDRVIETIEKIVAKKTTDEPYTHNWCVFFDKYLAEVRAKLAANAASNAEAGAPKSGAPENLTVPVAGA